MGKNIKSKIFEMDQKKQHSVKSDNNILFIYNVPIFPYIKITNLILLKLLNYFAIRMSVFGAKLTIKKRGI
ncbi:hypothetical protein AWI08_01915 [Klebsiella aerogenes]|nr:hypothetical protein AWI08_01915 [Klebsiella aerogenes]